MVDVYLWGGSGEWWMYICGEAVDVYLWGGSGEWWIYICGEAVVSGGCIFMGRQW